MSGPSALLTTSSDALPLPFKTRIMYYINLLELKSVIHTNKSTLKLQNTKKKTKKKQSSTWAVGVHKAVVTRQLMNNMQHHRRTKHTGVHQVTAKIAPLGAGKQKHKCLAQFNSQNECQLKMHNSHVFQDHHKSPCISHTHRY